MLTNPPRMPETPGFYWKRNRRVFLLCAGLFFLILSGCTSLRDWAHNGFKVGPNYQKPPAPVASEWIDSKSQGVNVAREDLCNWWKVFNDPVLNTLVDQAYRQNLDVRTAGTRILAARAQRNIAAGNLFPQFQQAFASLTRNAISKNTANVPPGLDQFFDHNSVGVNLAWEVDFWGRFRRGIESADAELDASVVDYDDALVLLISEVAATYVEIRVFQQRLAFAEENIALQRKLVVAAEDRFKGGVGRLIDQGQQRSNLYDTLALKEELLLGLRLANNRLCVLLGQPVTDLIPQLGIAPIPVTPPEVVVGMPADLLRRRPDVRFAERLVKAQNARIGVATSNLYPRFRLIGVVGYEAENFGDLFTSDSLFGTIGPSVRWDILNYGRLLNGIRVEDAKFQTTVLQYQQTVLRAGREVEDGIALYLQSQRRTRQLVDSVKEAKVAADEAVTLSKEKKFDLNQAFVTSSFLTSQQDKLALASGDIALGLIATYKALGGGWQIRCAPEDGVVPPTPNATFNGPEPLPDPQALPKKQNQVGMLSGEEQQEPLLVLPETSGGY